MPAAQTPPTIVDRPPAGRPWYKRLTVVAGGAFALLTYLQQSGVVPPGTAEETQTATQMLVEAAKTIAGLGASLGVYRHVANLK